MSVFNRPDFHDLWRHLGWGANTAKITVNSSVDRASHRSSRGHGFKPPWSPEFFSGFFTQLHKLRSLRRSFLHFQTLRPHKVLMRNARTHPLHTSWLFQLFKISILIKQNHQRVPTSVAEKSRAVYLLMSTESENLSSLRSRHQKG